MGTITEWRFLGSPAPTQFEVAPGFDHISICINEIRGSSKPHRTTLWISEDLWVIAHYRLIQVVAQNL